MALGESVLPVTDSKVTAMSANRRCMLVARSATVLVVGVVAVAGFVPWYAKGPNGNPFRQAMGMATSWKMGDLSQSRREEVSGLLEKAVKGEALPSKTSFNKWMASPLAKQAYQEAMDEQSGGKKNGEKANTNLQVVAKTMQELSSSDRDAQILSEVAMSPAIQKLKAQVAERKAALASEQAKLSKLEAIQKEHDEAKKKEGEEEEAKRKKILEQKEALKNMNPGEKIMAMMSGQVSPEEMDEADRV